MICCGTSFLFSLYGNDVNSPQAVAWIAQCTEPVSLSAFTRYELENALRFAEFRRTLAPGAAAKYLIQFEAAIAQGRLVIAACNLADVVDEARRLSALHTLSGGHRAFDILQVATALKLGATQFLSFDARQKQLATAEGLQVPL